MDELIKSIFDILANGKTPEGLQNLQVSEDKDGKVTITYQKPQTPKEVVEFKQYVDSLEDDIFEQATHNLRQQDPKTYSILTNEQIPDLEAYVNATLAFKFYVKQYAQSKIDIAKSENDKLYATINLNKERIKYLQKYC